LLIISRLVEDQHHVPPPLEEDAFLIEEESRSEPVEGHIPVGTLLDLPEHAGIADIFVGGFVPQTLARHGTITAFDVLS